MLHGLYKRQKIINFLLISFAIISFLLISFATLRAMAATTASPMWEDIPEEVGMMDPQEYWEGCEGECGVEAPNEEGMGDE